MGKKNSLNFFSTKDTTGFGGRGEASLGSKKLKKLDKLQQQYIRGEISEQQYNKLAKDIKQI